MKILHFYKTYKTESFGGTEQFIYHLCRATSKLGLENGVLTLSREPGDVIFDDHNVYRAKLDFEIASTGFSFAALKRFSQLAQEADVIHYHFPWPFMDLVHFWSRPQKPTVVTYHADIIRQKRLLMLYKPLQSLFLKSVDAIVSTSPNYRETSLVLKNYADKVSVIPIGLDEEAYPMASSQRTRYWQSLFQTRFFLFIGVLRYYKGLFVLLKAAKFCKFPIVIVGEGPVEAELKQYAKQHHLSHVHFVGEISDEDKAALLALSYAVLLPSQLRAEAFGITLLEGAMFGKAMITCEIGTGTSFVNINEETGKVIPPNDDNALKAAMQYLWDHPEICAQMGQAARARYLEHFTAEKMAKQYYDLYQRLPTTTKTMPAAKHKPLKIGGK